jgi:hypothetical protein
MVETSKSGDARRFRFKRQKVLLERLNFSSRRPLALLIAASDLPGLTLIRFRYVPVIDDFFAELNFRGHVLDLRMAWDDGSVSLTADQAMPEQLFDQVAHHLSTHKIRWLKGLTRFREFERQYRRPAKATWYEKS